MTDENLFRNAVLVAVCCFAPFGVYRRFQAHTGEKLDRWQEGGTILFGLRLGAVPLFVAGVAWMVEPGWLAWSSLGLPGWLRWMGVWLVVASGLLVVWTFANLGKNITDTVVTRKVHSLITSGPYRHVRHPFYLAFAIGLTGISLASSNWFLATLGLIPLAFIVARTRIEEQKLIDRFGLEYQDYMQRVPRYIPRLPISR